MAEEVSIEAAEVKKVSRRNVLKAAMAAGGAAVLGFPNIVEATGRYLDALAEHLAVQRYFPRVRARLRQEGQRHDRRRIEDRSFARGRGGAGLWPARRRVERAHSTAATACSRTITVSRLLSRSGVRVRLWHGRQHATRLAQVRRRQGSARTSSTTSIGANVVSFPYGPMPTQPLGWFKKPITKADDFKGLKFRTVGLSIDVFTGMGAAVNALPGGEIVPAMDRGLLDAAEFNNASSDRILGFPDVSKGLHAAELPPERRAVRDHVQQDQVRCAAGQR